MFPVILLLHLGQLPRARSHFYLQIQSGNHSFHHGWVDFFLWLCESDTPFTYWILVKDFRDQSKLLWVAASASKRKSAKPCHVPTRFLENSSRNCNPWKTAPRTATSFHPIKDFPTPPFSRWKTIEHHPSSPIKSSENFGIILFSPQLLFLLSSPDFSAPCSTEAYDQRRTLTGRGRVKRGQVMCFHGKWILCQLGNGQNVWPLQKRLEEPEKTGPGKNCRCQISFFQSSLSSQQKDPWLKFEVPQSAITYFYNFQSFHRTMSSCI